MDGVRFNADFHVYGNNKHKLRLFTDTPCCLDVCYSADISNVSIKYIKRAIDDKQVSLKFVDNHNWEIEFKYRINQVDESVLLDCDDREDIPDKNIKLLKNYFALVRELETTKERLIEAYRELSLRD